MLCCGRKKDSRGASNQRIVGEGGGLGMRYITHPGYPIYQDPMDLSTGTLIGGPPLRRAVHFPVSAYSFHSGDTEASRHPDMVIQGDFRKVSGITSEIFRQIEAVEREYDAITAAHMEAAEKRGEMLIRLLDPRNLGKAGAEVARKYLEPNNSMNGPTSVQFVEIVKRPGQTLGLYIREGDGFRSSDGVFISRIALESPVYSSGLLKVGDEILAVNLVDVRRMSLDDVVIIMSIPRRLVLTIRSRAGRPGGPIISGPAGSVMMGNRRLYEGEEYRQLPVVVLKKEFGDEEYGTDDLSSSRDDENNHNLSADRLRSLPGAEPPLGYLPRESDSYSESPYGYVRLVPRPLSARPSDSWSVSGGTLTRKPLFPGVSGPVIPNIASINNSLASQRFRRTMDSLNQIYSGYNSDVQYSSLSRGAIPSAPGRTAMLSRSFIDRGSPSRAGNRFLGEGDYADIRALRHNIRLLRTGSENNISPLARDNYSQDYYMRPRSRSSGRPMTSADYHNLVYHGKGPHDIRASFSTQGLSSILRHRGQSSATDGSVSDTEVGGMTNSLRQPAHWRHKSGGSGGRYGSSSRDAYQWKSSSLPRQTGSGLASGDYRYNRSSSQPRRTYRGGQSVRFERNNPAYNSAYDDDSDGALSAPELPENYRPKRSLGLTSGSTSVGSVPTTSGVSVTEPNVSAIGGDQLRFIPNPTPVKASEEERLHLLTLNPREFFKYRYEKPPPESETSPSTGTTGDTSTRGGKDISSDTDKEGTSKPPQGFNGILWIHLLAGRGLRSGSVPTNHRDLYCVIECDRVHKARTVVRSGESSFDWDEIFELDMVENKEISFLLYSWDPQYRHKLCYKGSINLIGLSLVETPVHSLALKMEPKGTLYIKIRYKDISIAFQRTALSPTIAPANAVFGLGLETLVERENSGLSVPLIVKRCTQEVEKRGLNLVGIYRLCGSAVRKKLLREAFEKNSWLVDLSAEHVPDINVITSLLKDYIRELPEPLFTKALFDMMVDGLSVCLPDDPPGNAKLMFSILECLPKINRSTVLYLMDHLKLVELQCDRNKMNSQALAAAFGPLFTSHSESESLRKPVEVFKFLIEIWPSRRVSTSRSDSDDSLLNTSKPGQTDATPSTTTTGSHHLTDANSIKISTPGATLSTSCLPPSSTSSSSSSSSVSTAVPIIGPSLTYVTSTRDSHHHHTTTHHSYHQHSKQQHHQPSHRHHHQLRSSTNDDNLEIPSLTPGPSPTQLNELPSPDSPPLTRTLLNTNSSINQPSTTSSGPIISSQNYSDTYSSTNPFRPDHYLTEATTATTLSSNQQQGTSTAMRDLESSETTSGLSRGGLIGSGGPSDRSTIKKSVAWAAGTRNNDDFSKASHNTDSINVNTFIPSNNNNTNSNANHTSNTQATPYLCSSSTVTKELNIGTNVINTITGSSSSSARDRYTSSLGDNISNNTTTNNSNNNNNSSSNNNRKNYSSSTSS